MTSDGFVRLRISSSKFANKNDVFFPKADKLGYLMINRASVYDRLIGRGWGLGVGRGGKNFDLDPD